MTLNPNNDVYTGDLSLLNARKHAWSKAEKGGSVYRIAAWVILAIGFGVVVFMSMRPVTGDSLAERLPVHVCIWVTCLITYLVARQGRKRSEKPFDGFHMSRFEIDDDTVYYVYQQGMSLRTYAIKDDNIRKIYRDDEWGALLIEGDADIVIEKRNSVKEEHVTEFYALVPFDKYDLDDMLKPYGKKVKSAKGKLREKYTAEHLG